MDQKAIVEANGSIGFDELLAGWTDSNFRDLHLTFQPRCRRLHTVGYLLQRPSLLNVSGEKGNGAGNSDVEREPSDTFNRPAKSVLLAHGDQRVNDAG